MSTSTKGGGQLLYNQGTTKKYDIPIAHLDYKYIEECSDVKELEKILKILKSGDEGCFPEMEKVCEEKITELDPNSRVLRKESNILTMSGLDRKERQEISEDLKNWTSDMKSSEGIPLPKGNEFDDDSLPPIRSGKVIMNGHDSQGVGEKAETNNKSVKPRSYAEWDKFDVEKELDNVDKKEEKKKAKQTNHQPEVEHVIDTSGMSDTEKAMKATREKDKGNEAFRSGDFKEAIAYYTRSIQLQSTAASFNNRALAHLKEQEWMKAEMDCNKVLSMEPDNIKALLRRGSAYKGKKEFSKALTDFQRVLELEPANKKAEDMIEELQKEEKKYEKEKKERREKGRRMVIEDVEGSDDSGDEIVVDKKPSSEKKDQSQGKPMVNGFHETANQNSFDKKLPEQNAHAARKEEELGTSNQRKDNKSIWDEDEVPARNVTKQEQKSSNKGGQSTEKLDSENLLRHQENVAACENSNNINIENEMKGTGNRIEIEERNEKENENKKSQGEGSLEEKQNEQNEEKESRDEKSEDGSKAMVERKEESYKIQTLDRPVYVQHVLPNDVAALREEGNGLFRTGQYGDAIEKYNQAIKTLKSAQEDQRYNLSLLFSNRAACHLKTGDVSQAVKDCTTSLELVPHATKPLLRRGNAYEALERYDKAYVDYRHALQIDSSVDIALQGSTRCQNHLQQTHGIKWREKMPPIPTVFPWEIPEIRDPTGISINQSAVSPVATPSSAQSPSEQSSSSSSSSSSESSTKRQTPSTPVLSIQEQYEQYKTEGNNLVKESEYRQAIARYSCCIELMPDQAVAYTNRSLCYLRTNQAENAEADCTQALKIEPENVKALFRRAQSKKMLKRYKESMEDLILLLKLDPKNTAAKKEMDVVKNYYKEELNSMKQKMGEKKEAIPKTTQSKPRKRMVIQEVDEEEEEDAKPSHSKNTSSTKKEQQSTAKSETTTPPASKEKVKVEEIKTTPSKKKSGNKSPRGKSETNKDPRSSSQKKSETPKTGCEASRPTSTESQGKTTVNEPKQSKVSSKPTKTTKVTSSGLPLATPSVPHLQEKATPYEFMQAWNSLKSAQDIRPYSELLRQISPDRIPEVISNKLDHQMLNKITKSVSNHYIPNGEYELSYRVLSQLCKVDRFQTIAMFLSREDKKEIQSVIDKLRQRPEGYSAADLDLLKKNYGIK